MTSPDEKEISLDIMGMDRIDNSVEGKKIYNVLNSLLSQYGEADFASGYFNIGGFQLIAKQLTGARRFRLLLGREPGYRGHLRTQTGNPVEIMDRQFRQDINSEELREETISIVDSLIDFLKKDYVEVRLYTRGFFHAKAYIFPNVTIVGSSNFTAAGMTANSELNAVQHGGDSAKGYKKWFEKFWEQSEDFKGQLIEILTRSKFGDYEYMPYEILMKTLYTYFKDELQFESSFAGKSAVELTDFQEEAFEKAKRILTKYGGVIIADSVGLGKTYIGKKLLEHYAYHLRQKALVICPAQLRDSIWKKQLIEANISARVISQEELGQSTFPFEEYNNIDIILIDESHNFRNYNNRFDNLNRIVGGNRNVKIIMMTATPINNTLFDLYNQISFVTRGNDGYFHRAGIRDLKDYFKRAEAGQDNLFNLLEEIVIRRTRHYIKEHYKDAMIKGRKIHFPTRKLKTIHYDLGATYSQIYKYIVESMEQISFTAYNIEGHKRIKQDMKKNAQGKALIGLMKTLVLKRFESSVEAFRITIERQLFFHRKVLDYLDDGLLLDSSSYGKILKFMEMDDDDRVDKLKDALPKIEGRAYDMEAIRANIIEDVGILSKMGSAVNSITPDRDTKLQEFKKKIAELQGKKLLVFTYFKDTAKYIFGAIQKDAELLNRIGANNVKLIDSDIDPRYRLKYIESFAPHANKKEHIVGTPDEIDILISTDVLSEGQNLQDSDLLINYDLHWNPTRMIQRAGRIDRMGTEFDTLTIYNIFPEEGLEDLLGLVKRLQERIARIDENIGLDASILGEIVDPKTFNALQRIAGEDGSIIDEIEEMAELASHEFMKQQLAKFMVARGRSYLEHLPDGIYSGMSKNKGKGVFYYFKTDADHYWRYYNTNTCTIIDNKFDIFNHIYCDEDEPRVIETFDKFVIMEKVKQHILSEIEEKRILARLPRLLDKAQRDISALLEANLHTVPEKAEEIMKVIPIMSEPLPRTFQKELRGILKEYRGGGKFRDMVDELIAFRERYFGRTIEEETEKLGEEKEEDEEPETKLKLVCYELIT